MSRFSQVDVFTDELMFGNPVAVVHDADRLSTEQMAAFARWTNLAETTFLLSPTDPAADYRVRIFTIARELPFAGHPTLGSARAWLEAGGVPRAPGRIVQQCGAGLVHIRDDADGLAFAAPPLLRDGPVDPAELAEIATAVGLRTDEIVDAQWADNGPGWVGLLLKDADAVLALRPDRATMGSFHHVGVVGAHPAGGVADFEVRAFTAMVASGEDPVTGSLNAALAQWMIPNGLAPRRYTAAQGTQLGRRGRIRVEQLGEDFWIGGDTVIGISGTVNI